MKHRSKKFLRILLVIIIILVILRLILPYVLLSYSNKTLSELPGYRGHIEDIDLALVKGSYRIAGFNLDKIDSATNQLVPFLSTDAFDIHIDMKSLVRQRKIVTDLSFLNPVIRFTMEKAEPEDIAKDTVNFRQIIKKLTPFKIDRFEVTNGVFQFIDSTTTPAVNMKMDNIEIVATDLSSADDTSALPSTVKVKANVYGGSFDLKMRLNPMMKIPTFDMNFSLDNLNLTELNAFFKAYGKIDVNKGTFGLYSEVAGRNNRFVGYVKPVIKDLDIVGPQDRKDSFLNKLWEGVASVAESIFENKKEDQVATKIPISGRYDDPSVSVWYAFVNILRNAFVQAIYPSIDNQINLSSLKKKDGDKTVLEKIFGSSDKKDDKSKKEKEKEKDKKEERKRDNDKDDKKADNK